MNKIEILECDFSIDYHKEMLVGLMNDYISDEMGGGKLIEGLKAKKLVEGLQAHPSKLILFAALNGKIVGLTNCFVNFGTFAVAPFINIHDIIVNKEARGYGAGRALMGAIVKKAKELGCAKITLEVREDNQLAQNLYKSMGFDECGPRMYFWSKYL